MLKENNCKPRILYPLKAKGKKKKQKQKRKQRKDVLRQKKAERTHYQETCIANTKHKGVFRPKENYPRGKHRGTEPQEEIKSIRKGKWGQIYMKIDCLKNNYNQVFGI